MTTETDNEKPEGEQQNEAVRAHRGQVRVAYRLAEEYDGRLLHVRGLGWHAWDGRRWAPEADTAAHQAVLNVLRLMLAESLSDKMLRQDVGRCESANGIDGVLRIAQHLDAFAVTVDELDADPYLLNTANGILDLRTLELRPHDPAARLTKVTAGAWRPDEAPSGPWAEFLRRVLPDAEVRGFLQRLTGVALLGEVREHVLPILTGTGSNGKSVFTSTVEAALGDYALSADPALLLHRPGAHTTGLTDLRGARFVLTSESDRGERLAESTVKRLTGGDRITARRMRQDHISFTPTHSVVMVTNHLPVVSGDDPAMFRRLRVVPFDVVIPADEQDPALATHLQAHADEVLAWAISGYADYQIRGLAEPEAVLVATDSYRVDSDAVARFVAECCLTGSAVNKATTAILYARWEAWLRVEGVEPISQRAFGKHLDRLGFLAAKGSGGQRFRQGIQIKPEGDSEADPAG